MGVPGRQRKLRALRGGVRFGVLEVAPGEAIRRDLEIDLLVANTGPRDVEAVGSIGGAPRRVMARLRQLGDGE